MIPILSDIWDAVRDIPYLVVDLLITAVNGWILAIALLAETLLALLPPFPDPPPAPGGILGALLWVVDLGTILAFFSLMVTAWITFLGIKVGLKWVKAL